MPTKEVDNISIHRLLSVIWRRKFIIAVPALLLTGAFATYAHYLPEKYQAQALISIDPQAYPGNVQTPPVDEQLLSIREIVLGRPLIGKVITEFNLHSTSPDPVEDIKSKITVDVVNTRAIRVGFQGDSPEQVALVANRLAESFVNQTARTQTQTATKANGLIQDELESLRGKLASQSQQIQDYKERVGGALPERLPTNLKGIEVLEDRIQVSNNAIAADQAARAAAVKEMSELEKRGALEPSVSKDQTPGQRKLDELRLNLAQARTKYTDKNPEVVNLQKQIKDLAQSQPQGDRGHAEPSAVSLRYVQLSAELEGIDQRLQSERDEVASLTADLRKNQGLVASVPQHESQLALLMRDYATTQESYQALLAKQNVAEVAGVAGVGDGSGRMNRGPQFIIAEPARPPLTPYSPLRARISLMGLFAGLALGSLIAFAAEQNDTSFLNAEDFGRFTSLPVLAEIPSLPKSSGRSNVSRVATVKEPASVAAELYYTLATKVQRRCQDKSPSILTITSATGGEGKTLTSLNLSIALAKSLNGKVLLIDADLRRPMLHEYLELDDVKRKGFGDLLLHPEDNIHKYILRYNGLSVLPTFERVRNPLGMLSTASARALLERISQEFSLIVLDSPPIVPIADGHVLADLADHVLLIARARRTPRELFKLAVESLDSSKLIGVALNDVDLRQSRYSSAYSYYQTNYQADSCETNDHSIVL